MGKKKAIEIDYTAPGKNWTAKQLEEYRNTMRRNLLDNDLLDVKPGDILIRQDPDPASPLVKIMPLVVSEVTDVVIHTRANPKEGIFPSSFLRKTGISLHGPNHGWLSRRVIS